MYAVQRLSRCPPVVRGSPIRLSAENPKDPIGDQAVKRMYLWGVRLGDPEAKDNGLDRYLVFGSVRVDHPQRQTE
jgi:hypothetical protein